VYEPEKVWDVIIRHGIAYSAQYLGYGPDDPGFESWQGQGTFLVSKQSRPVLGLIGCRDSSLGLKRPGREFDHSAACRAEVRREWSCAAGCMAC